MDHEQTKQLLAAEKVRAKQSEAQAALQERELRFNILRIAHDSADKLVAGAENDAKKAGEMVIEIATAYAKWIDNK